MRKLERKVPRGPDISDTVQLESFKVCGRNDPCPCGSGKKFKKCKCYQKYIELREYMTPHCPDYKIESEE